MSTSYFSFSDNQASAFGRYVSSSRTWIEGTLLVFFGLISCYLSAQSEVPRGDAGSKSLSVNFTTAPIVLDGILDDPAWQTADQTDFYWQFFPTDSARASHATVTRVLYDATTLYVAIRADSPNGDYVVASLKRDFGGTTNDNVSLLFDTYSDGANAYFFGVTPYGVQREGLVSNGGSVFNNTWDVKWRAESKMYDDHYIVEIAIPFTSLKFPEAADRWRFRSYRWNLQTNEQSSWVRVPQEQPLSSLAFMGDLVFEKPLGKSRTPVAIIPYVNVLGSKDRRNDQNNTDLGIGGDAKIALGNSLNLDVTLNPDFSNVEVDALFTNLTRFEVLLPERRQFFIDNNDLFDNFGSIYRDASPFFSRRIGLARDTSGALIENRIIGGARLSGKLNENWRLGVLNIQTAADEPNEIPSNNNSMLALQRKVFKRSTVGAFLVNRQTFGDYEFLEENDRYNRVAGIDYNLASADNTWTGKFYAHKSFSPDDSRGNISSQATTTYNTRHWNILADFVYVDQEFQADLGFVPRKGIFKNGVGVAYTFYPKRGILNTHRPRVTSLVFWRPEQDWQRTDHTLRYAHLFNFRGGAVAEGRYTNQYIYLTNPFDPTRTPGAEPLPGDQDYRFGQFEATYTSNNTKLITYGLETTVGNFFNGQLYSIGVEAALRFQPWGQLSLAVNYDGIRLPLPYPSANLWLLSPRLDVTFSKSLFWSTVFQYSNQRENLGINSRLQWRFAPLSDLYLVYNDNYGTSPFMPTFRSLNIKATYWLNL